MDSRIRNANLASQGKLTVEWAENRMPLLTIIRKTFEREKPLKGIRIGACLHVTKETAVLVRTLIAGGAEVVLCGSNPLSTQDDVAAALAGEDIAVYAWRGQTTEEYYQCINSTLDHKPMITIDDGADLISMIHSKRPNLAETVIGGTEETTTGVTRLKALAEKSLLLYPVIGVNEAYTKYLFDNRYGTGQSIMDGIMRATSILLAGKTMVVCGYGWCGKGAAARARGMGGRVIVVEVNPIRALEALMDGFTVSPLAKAAEIGDLFITVTGDINVIRAEHMEKMKDGAILCNAGHFNAEISLTDLERLSLSKRQIRPNVDEYTLKGGLRLYLLAEGRLVNLSAAEGHPPEVMMMSFANQALSVRYLVQEGKNLPPLVHKVPVEIDNYVAELALKCQGIEIDTLTEEQKKYLSSWELGTV